MPGDVPTWEEVFGLPDRWCGFREVPWILGLTESDEREEDHEWAVRKCKELHD